MTTHTITHHPDLAYCTIDGTRQRWSVARGMIPMSDITRLMLAQIRGEALAITVAVAPQPVQVACDEFVEPDDRKFLAMMRR